MYFMAALTKKKFKKWLCFPRIGWTLYMLSSASAVHETCFLLLKFQNNWWFSQLIFSTQQVGGSVQVVFQEAGRRNLLLSFDRKQKPVLCFAFYLTNEKSLKRWRASVNKTQLIIFIISATASLWVVTISWKDVDLGKENMAMLTLTI